MNIGKKTSLIWLITASVLFGLILNAAAETPKSDYERYYPKYIDSKEPLAAIQSKDNQAVRKAEQDIELELMPSPETIQYGRLQIQQLDIYRYHGDRHKPVIFFIHAGNEDKNSVAPAIPAWLGLGFTVVSINHRSVPENSFPEMFEDCNMALKWVIDHIQDFGGDPDRIAVTGTSCGAHLAALLVTDIKSHQKYGIDARKVKCWFLMSGFYDMDLKENLISPIIKDYIEQVCVPSKRAASPVALVTGKEPPCLIIHGGDDWCVPKTNAVSLYNQLDKDKATLAILKGYMHANVFYSYLNPNHEPARLIKNFLATYLPTPQNQNPKNERGKP
ncbi:MAG: alpha/beta hydrolase [Desulfosalsimonadaceae bacterium]